MRKSLFYRLFFAVLCFHKMTAVNHQGIEYLQLGHRSDLQLDQDAQSVFGRNVMDKAHLHDLEFIGLAGIIQLPRLPS